MMYALRKARAAKLNKMLRDAGRPETEIVEAVKDVRPGVSHYTFDAEGGASGFASYEHARQFIEIYVHAWKMNNAMGAAQ